MKYDNVDKKTVDILIEKSEQLDIPLMIEEGSLLDNYLFINNGKLKLGKSKKKYKYIVVLEKYLNEWSSTWTLITTNNIERLEIFKDRIDEIGELI